MTMLQYWNKRVALISINGRLASGEHPARRVAEPHMSRKQYFVSYEDAEWIIKLEDRFIGGHLSKVAAVRAAIDAAHLEGSRGSDAEVLVLTENNMYRTMWRHGRDPYPPT
jgi:hypothetical protein